MNRIPYHRIPPADAYQRVQQAQELRQPSRAETPDAARPAEARAVQQATPPPSAPPGLSTDEAAMIDRYFPSESKAGLRLYGRDGAPAVQPQRLGGHLDLSA
jgi:hypothetical protein